MKRVAIGLTIVTAALVAGCGSPAVGTWAHSHEMHALGRLPLALVRLRLIELDEPLPTSAKP